MRVECPQFTKCCFCLPLRYGLLVWGYIKLIAAVFLVIFSIGMIIKAAMVWDRTKAPLFIMTFMMLIALADVAFQLVFIIGAHKKAVKLLQVYYRATIIGLGAYVVAMLIFCGFILFSVLISYSYMSTRVVAMGCEQLAIIFVDIVLQVYLLLLVRSEITKLESQQQFRFVNIGAEAECTYAPEENFATNETIKA